MKCPFVERHRRGVSTCSNGGPYLRQVRHLVQLERASVSPSDLDVDDIDDIDGDEADDEADVENNSVKVQLLAPRAEPDEDDDGDAEAMFESSKKRNNSDITITVRRNENTRQERGYFMRKIVLLLRSLLQAKFG